MMVLFKKKKRKKKIWQQCIGVVDIGKEISKAAVA